MVNHLLGSLSHYDPMRWSPKKPDGPSAAPIFGVVAVFLPLLLFLLADRAGAAEGCREASATVINRTYKACLRACPPPTSFRARRVCFKDCKTWFYAARRAEKICKQPTALQTVSQDS